MDSPHFGLEAQLRWTPLVADVSVCNKDTIVCLYSHGDEMMKITRVHATRMFMFHRCFRLTIWTGHFDLGRRA